MEFLDRCPNAPCCSFCLGPNFCLQEHESSNSVVPELVNTASNIFPTSLQRLPLQPAYTYASRGGLTVKLSKFRHQGLSPAQAPRVLRITECPRRRRRQGSNGKHSYCNISGKLSGALRKSDLNISSLIKGRPVIHKVSPLWTTDILFRANQESIGS